jgi:DNA-binding PadR family transcriptional regulator
MPLDKELLKGSVATLVLSVLERDDMYGYRIIQELERMSDKTFQLNEGALYPVLHKLESQGYVSAYWEGEDGSRRRKFYHITPGGGSYLAKKRLDWQTFSRAMERIIYYSGGNKNA